MRQGGEVMKVRTFSVCLVSALLSAGCDECENGYRVVTEYKYVMSYDHWHETLKDEYFDGAIRITTWTIKNGRTLTLRCFKPSIDHGDPKLDVRYTIYTPLLKRIVPELNKAGAIEMVITVDDAPIGSVEVRPLAHDFGISFLGDINRETVDRIVAGTKSIVVMPRQGSEGLDDAIEFGIANLAKYIEPVMKACDIERPAVDPGPAPEPGESQVQKT